MIHEIRKMAMFLAIVEGQHLVTVLQSLEELAHPEVAGAGSRVSRDQQIGIAGHPCRVEHFLRPPQGFGHAARALDVDP